MNPQDTDEQTNRMRARAAMSLRKDTLVIAAEYALWNTAEGQQLQQITNATANTLKMNDLIVASELTTKTVHGNILSSGFGKSGPELNKLKQEQKQKQSKNSKAQKYRPNR
jgi:hypothetical protein